ncbi:hypothetical protein CK203_011250 [Vitis vinifera]|uniref:Uncharacterized protein n=1 Tax=Vitis vinifera TaxID=29760 RepID=A0A438JYF0_VITVI|nr:hypothetical protein CK203_011250 [Vitis vinifera]
MLAGGGIMWTELRLMEPGLWRRMELGKGLPMLLGRCVQSEGMAPFCFRLQFETLEPLDASALEIPFMEEEVFDALLGYNGDKAPGQMDSLWPFGNLLGIS